nr:hypothetical protein [uncultured Neokomagataea sp.]
MFKPKRYSLELVGALVFYTALLFAGDVLSCVVRPVGYLRFVISLLPMLGVIAGAWAILRGLWRMDEMQRRIQFDAIVLSFLGTALITLGWGFAESAGVSPLRAFYVWPIMCVLWCIGLVVARWRYS